MKFNTKIIEFLGLPKAGKTSTIYRVIPILRKKGYCVEYIEERASVSPVQDKLDPSFNLWTSGSFFTSYIEANSRGVDILIADRGIIDAHIWINLFLKGDKSDISYETYLSLYGLKLWDNIVKSYFFTCSIESALERERLIRQSSKGGRIMNKKMLDKYSESYHDLRDELQSRFRIKEINTDEMDLDVVVHSVVKEISRVVERKEQPEETSSFST